MGETNGGAIGGGAGDYRPRHAVPQIYQEMLDTFGDPNRPADREYIPKHYAPDDDPYGTAYYIPITDFYDPDRDAGPVPPWSPPEPERPEAEEEVGGIAEPFDDGVQEMSWLETEEGAELPLEDEPGLEPIPPQSPESPEELEPPPVASLLLHQPSAAEQGRLRHIIDDDVIPSFVSPPAPPPSAPSSTEPPPPVPLPEQKRGLRDRLRHAWYAGLTAVTTYFTNPEKGRRRRLVVKTAAVLGGAAAAIIFWPGNGGIDQPSQPDFIPTVPKPPTNTPPEPYQPFDVPHPHGYNHGGAMYEWSVVADAVGKRHATPELLRLIDTARGNGLRVDTWGDPTCGHWGITSVTVDTPSGTAQTYYSTARKLALLQQYAAK